jgi:O-antigen/teichoic acid export membrane protein
VALGALWPALAQAHAQGDRAWIAMTYRRGMLMTMVLVMALCSIAGCMESLVPLVLGTAAGPSPTLCWGLVAFSAASLWSGLHAQCLNALGQVRGPALLALIQAGINLPTTVMAVHFIGFEWLGWASACAALFSSVPGLTFLWLRRKI